MFSELLSYSAVCLKITNQFYIVSELECALKESKQKFTLNFHSNKLHKSFETFRVMSKLYRLRK